jgi:hypothetical protein
MKCFQKKGDKRKRFLRAKIWPGPKKFTFYILFLVDFITMEFLYV